MATELGLVADASEEKTRSAGRVVGTGAGAGARAISDVPSDTCEPGIRLVAHPRPRRLDGIRHRLQRLQDEERGAVTAEYAIVILAGVAFAGLLVAIMRSNEVRELLVKLVENALGSASP